LSSTTGVWLPGTDGPRYRARETGTAYASAGADTARVSKMEVTSSVTGAGVAVRVEVEVRVAVALRVGEAPTAGVRVADVNRG